MSGRPRPSGQPSQQDPYKIWRPSQDRLAESDSERPRYKPTTAGDSQRDQVDARYQSSSRGYKSDSPATPSISKHRSGVASSSKTLHHPTRPSVSSNYVSRSQQPGLSAPAPQTYPRLPPRSQPEPLDPRLRVHKRTTSTPAPPAAYERVPSSSEHAKVSRTDPYSRNGTIPQTNSTPEIWVPSKDPSSSSRRPRDRDNERRDRDQERPRETYDRRPEREVERRDDAYRDTHREVNRERETRDRDTKERREARPERDLRDRDREARDRETKERREARDREAKDRELWDERDHEQEPRLRESRDRDARGREAAEREAREREAKERRARRDAEREAELREREVRQKEREAREREAKERRTKEREVEREAKEREAKERRARETRDREMKEQEAKERRAREREAEREARDLRDREAREQERQAKEHEAREREAKEQEAKERKTREREAEREAKEQERRGREREAEREAREREAKEQERRARERDAEREAREREVMEQEVKERRAREREAEVRDREMKEQAAKERRAKEREAEREMRAMEAREREARELEARERDARERDAREREAEREARDRETKEQALKERRAKEWEAERELRATEAREREAQELEAAKEREAEREARDREMKEQAARERRAKEREAERELRAMEAREREYREREAKEREAREREAREREAREQEAREWEAEREAREREAREREAREREAEWEARDRDMKEQAAKERRAKEREAERELKAMEAREREAKEREAKEREAKEREAREREARELEAKEREAEREARDREMKEQAAKERRAKEREVEREQRAMEAREREAREREAKEREAEREARDREMKEQAAKERRAKERETEREQRAMEAREREAREQEAKEREAEREARDHEMKEQAAKERRAIEREAERELRAMEAREREYRERETREREARERETRERETREREAREREAREREAKEREAKERQYRERETRERETREREAEREVKEREAKEREAEREVQERETREREAQDREAERERVAKLQRARVPSSKEAEDPRSREASALPSGHRRHRSEDVPSSSVTPRKQPADSRQPSAAMAAVQQSSSPVPTAFSNGQANPPQPVYLSQRAPTTHRPLHDRAASTPATLAPQGTASDGEQVSRREHYQRTISDPRAIATASKNSIFPRPDHVIEAITPKTQNEAKYPSIRSIFTGSQEPPVTKSEDTGLNNSRIPPASSVFPAQHSGFASTKPSFISIRAGQGPSDPPSMDTLPPQTLNGLRESRTETLGQSSVPIHMSKTRVYDRIQTYEALREEPPAPALDMAISSRPSVHRTVRFDLPSLTHSPQPLTSVVSEQLMPEVLLLRPEAGSSNVSHPRQFLVPPSPSASSASYHTATPPSPALQKLFSSDGKSQHTHRTTEQALHPSHQRSTVTQSQEATSGAPSRAVYALPSSAGVPSHMDLRGEMRNVAHSVPMMAPPLAAVLIPVYQAPVLQTSSSQGTTESSKRSEPSIDKRSKDRLVEQDEAELSRRQIPSRAEHARAVYNSRPPTSNQPAAVVTRNNTSRMASTNGRRVEQNTLQPQPGNVGSRSTGFVAPSNAILIASTPSQSSSVEAESFKLRRQMPTEVMDPPSIGPSRRTREHDPADDTMIYRRDDLATVANVKFEPVAQQSYLSRTAQRELYASGDHISEQQPTAEQVRSHASTLAWTVDSRRGAVLEELKSPEPPKAILPGQGRETWNDPALQIHRGASAPAIERSRLEIPESPWVHSIALHDATSRFPVDEDINHRPAVPNKPERPIPTLTPGPRPSAPAPLAIPLLSVTDSQYAHLSPVQQVIRAAPTPLTPSRSLPYDHPPPRAQAQVALPILPQPHSNRTQLPGAALVLNTPASHSSPPNLHNPNESHTNRTTLAYLHDPVNSNSRSIDPVSSNEPSQSPPRQAPAYPQLLPIPDMTRPNLPLLSGDAATRPPVNFPQPRQTASSSIPSVQLPTSTLLDTVSLKNPLLQPAPMPPSTPIHQPSYGSINPSHSSTPAGSLYHFHPDQQATAPTRPPVSTARPRLPPQPSRNTSRESILITPAPPTSIPPKSYGSRASPMPPVTRQESRESRDSAKKKTGLFGKMFSSKTSLEKPYEMWQPPSTDLPEGNHSQASLQSIGKLTPLPSNSSASIVLGAPPVPPKKAPPPIAVDLSNLSNRKEPDQKVFSAFKFLHTKRIRTMSHASVEVQDGQIHTATNTVVGSPTQSEAFSQMQFIPPLRDPIVATHEWRNKEEAETIDRVKGGRRRPGVVFDMPGDDDPPEPPSGAVPIKKKLSRRRP